MGFRLPEVQLECKAQSSELHMGNEAEHVIRILSMKGRGHKFKVQFYQQLSFGITSEPCDLLERNEQSP